MQLWRGEGGAAARRYLESDAHRPEDYYLKDGPGLVDRWVLNGAGSVTSRSVIEGAAYEAWVDWVDPDTGEVRGTPRTRRRYDAAGAVVGVERSPRFAEMTVNCDKTLSLAAALYPEVSTALDAAQEDAAGAMLSWLAVHSRTRVGPKGAQVHVPVEVLEAASVVHHTSRSGDPHRHVHLQVSTRVLAAGGWRGLDTALMFRQQGALRGIGEAAITAHEGLRVALAARGLTFDAAAGDVVELRAAVPAMSKRSRQIAANLDQIGADWRAEHPGQTPGPRVVRGWHRLAWEQGRPDKKPGVAPDEDLWRAEIHATGYTHPTTGIPPAPRAGVGTIDRDQVASLAIEQAQARRSTWSTADLTEHAARLLAHAGVSAPRRVLMEAIEDITSRATALCESVAPAGWETGAVPDGYRHLTSRHVIRTERRLGDLLQTLTDTTTPGIDAAHLDYLLNRLDVAGVGREPLGEDQLAAVTAMSSGAGLVVVTGAAGAGKTRMLTAAAAVTRAMGSRQVVVAPSMKAALGAAERTGAAASSVHKLLHAHGWRWNEDGTRWHHLHPGQVDPATGRTVPYPSPELRLDARTQLVIDEAGMLDQEAALRLLDLARDAGAQVVMIGDIAQLGAVGRGGVLDLATRHTRDRVDLATVHRFTDPTYATLTLAIRERRQPAATFEQLVRRGQVRLHETQEESYAAIAADAARTLSVRSGETVALTAASVAEATALNAAVHDARVHLGQVHDSVSVTGADGLEIGVGDHVMVRRNDPLLGIANRETFTVTRIHPDGALTVTDTTRRRHTLPAAYVAEHTHLGYATTGHGNQGVTTAHSHTLLTQGTDGAGLYVGLTRGRETNTVHLVAGDLGTARDIWTDAMQRDTGDHGLQHARRDLVRQLDGYQPDAPAPRSVLGRRNPSSFGLIGLLGHALGSGSRGPDLGR